MVLLLTDARKHRWSAMGEPREGEANDGRALEATYPPASARSPRSVEDYCVALWMSMQMASSICSLVNSPSILSPTATAPGHSGPLFLL